MSRRSMSSPTSKSRPATCLLTLDKATTSIAADQAQAQIDTEKLSLQRFDAQIAGAKASVAAGGGAEDRP